MTDKVKPLEEYCETCGAEPGTPCERPPGCVGGFHSARWDWANQAYEGRLEDRVERHKEDDGCPRYLNGVEH